MPSVRSSQDLWAPRAQRLSWLALAIGGVVLASLPFGESLSPFSQRMPPMTAACIVLLALSQLPDREARPLYRQAARIACLLVLFAVFTFLTRAFLGVDATWEKASPLLAAPSPATDAMALLAAVAILLRTAGAKGRPVAAAWVAAGVMLIGYGALLCYLYRVDTAFLIGSVAPHSAAAFLAIALAVWLRSADASPAAIFLSRLPSSVLARQLSIATLLVLPAAGWVRLQGQEAGYFDTRFGLAVMVGFSGVLLVAGIALASRKAQRSEESTLRIQRLYAALSHVNQAIVATEDASRVAREICRAIVERAGFAFAWIAWTDPAPRGMRFAAGEGTPQGFAEAALAHIHQDPAAGDVVARMMGGGPPRFFSDLDDVDLARRAAILEREQVRSAAMLPVVADGKCRAMIFVYSRSHRTFDEEERALLGEIGRDMGFSITLLDLAASRRDAEREILRLNENLEQRVVARTRELETANEGLRSFSYAVSHDLRSPIRSVDGYAALLDHELQGGNVQGSRDLLGRIRSATHLMSDLVDGLISLAQVTSVPIASQPVDLSQLARDIVEALRSQSPARDVEVRVDAGITGWCDPPLARALLQNLLENAWKFTSKVAHGRIAFTVDRAGPEPVYEVRDNGMGFDPAFKSQLFNAFVRVHAGAEYAGNGIGLATAKRIVGRHGGEIWADAKPGEGAAFCFTLGRGAA